MAAFWQTQHASSRSKSSSAPVTPSLLSVTLDSSSTELPWDSVDTPVSDLVVPFCCDGPALELPRLDENIGWKTTTLSQ